MMKSFAFIASIITVCHYLIDNCQSTIEEFIEIAQSSNQSFWPQWVQDTIKKIYQDRPLPKTSSPILPQCTSVQQLTESEDFPFPGKFCFVQIWKDVSMTEIMHDPRRNWCEQLTWMYDGVSNDICTMWGREYMTCHTPETENNPQLRVGMGYVPSICPQYTCDDWGELHYGISKNPTNMLTHYTLPDDYSGNQIKKMSNDTFYDRLTNLGYIRHSNSSRKKGVRVEGSQQLQQRLLNDLARYQNSKECPTNMLGISYFWNDETQKSCTVLQHDKKTNENIHRKQEILVKLTQVEERNEEFINSRCKTQSTTQFLGCIYKTQQDCIHDLQNIEYTKIKAPTKLAITMSLFYELFLNVGGEEVDATDRYQKYRSQEEWIYGKNNETQQKTRENQQRIEEESEKDYYEEDSGILTEIRINLLKVTIEIKQMARTYKICSDYLYDFADMIPFLPKDITIKFCLKFKDFRAFMPANEQIFIRFTPIFSVILRKKTTISSFGFSAGIEYESDPYSQLIGLYSDSDWMQPKNSMCYNPK